MGGRRHARRTQAQQIAEGFRAKQANEATPRGCLPTTRPGGRIGLVRVSRCGVVCGLLRVRYPRTVVAILRLVPRAEIRSSAAVERRRARLDGRQPKAVKDDWTIFPEPGRSSRGGWRPVSLSATAAKRTKAGGMPLAMRSPDAPGQVYWLYQRRLYVTTDSALKPEDVLALLNEAANTRRLRLEKAHALQAMTARLDVRARREPIPQDVKVAVWQRDGGRCATCGSNLNLEFDHIIPLAMGGANTMRNLQLLCETCNRRKGASLG